jgi:hypothetical protein
MCNGSSEVRASRNGERIRSRDLAAGPRELFETSCLLKIRGRRECRAPNAPAASHAKVKSIRVSHHGHTGSPGIPYAMVLTGSFALSPVTGLVCHRRQRSCLRQLDASVGASGPHDFAVRVRAIRQARSPRPPHPVPYVRDDRETPLCVGQDSTRYRADLGLRKIRIFLQTWLDRANQIEPVQQFALLAQSVEDAIAQHIAPHGEA